MVVRLPMSGTIAGAPAACTATEARRAWRVGAALKADCTATLLLRAAAIMTPECPVVARTGFKGELYDNLFGG
jgi:hypothetical protein